MKLFYGVFDGKNKVIQGETIQEAMKKAGYIPLTSTTSHNRIVGQLTDGRRYSVTITPRVDLRVR